MRRVPIVATVLALGVGSLAMGSASVVAVAPAAGAATISVSPNVAAATGEVQTLMTVTGTGLTAASIIEFADCKNATGPQPGWTNPPAPEFSNGALTTLVGGWNPGTTCDVVVKTDGAVSGTAPGAWTWTTDAVNWVTTTAINPSILPLSGNSSFLLTGNKANDKPTGDQSFAGATSASLLCTPASGGPDVTVAADITVVNDNQVTVRPTDRSGIADGTPCTVSVTLMSGNVVRSGNLNPSGVWFENQVPSLTLFPTAGPASQNNENGKAQWITVASSSSGIDKVTKVQFANCPDDVPWSEGLPAVGLKVNADGKSLSVQVPNLPPGTCSVLVTLPPEGSRPDGYTVASVPPTGGFTFQSPYQGEIFIKVVNPYTQGRPNSGIKDADLVISAIASPAGGAMVAEKKGNTGNALEGLNKDTLVGVDFNKIDSYNATEHSATISMTPQIDSGNLYFSNKDISGPAPNPVDSQARYGFVEFTYDNAGLDMDLTLIDQIGVTMSSELLQADPSDPNDRSKFTPIDGSYRDTGCLVQIVNGLSTSGVNMAPADGTSKGVMRWVDSSKAPSPTPSPGGWTAKDLSDSTNWAGLIGASKRVSAYPSVKDYTDSVTGPLTIDDNVSDAKYGGEMSYRASLADGLWTLTGTVKDGEVLGPKIEVEAAGLWGAGNHSGTGYGVYGQDGPFQIFLPTGTPGNPSWATEGLGWSSDGMAPAEWKNTVKTIYRDLIAGFAYGYWDGPYGGGTDSGKRAKNFTRNPVTDAYKQAQPTYPKDGNTQYAWNVYDDVVRSLSNLDGEPAPSGDKRSGAYGMPYSDTFVPEALSPNQQQGFAREWVVTLGDPKGCPQDLTQDRPTIEPALQSVLSIVGRDGTPLPVGTPVEDTEISEMVEYSSDGFDAPVTYSLTTPAGKPVDLPDGLTFHTNTGVISGTPTATMAPAHLIVTGTDGTSTAQAKVTFGVGSRLIIPSTQSVVGTIGNAITPTVAYTETRFDTDPTYSTDPKLPPGLAIDVTSGVISGVPSQAQPATNYVVTALGKDGTAQAIVSIEIDDGWFIAPPSQMVAGVVGENLTGMEPFTVRGYTGDPVYSISPTLPDGLTLSAKTGVISGSPDEILPTTVYTVEAKGDVDSAFAKVTLTITDSDRALSPPTQSVTITEDEYGSTAPLHATGLATPVTLTISPTTLPQGMSFNADTGVVSGTPTQSENTTTYTVTAQGAKGAKATAAIQLTVKATKPADPTLTPSNQTWVFEPGKSESTAPLYATGLGGQVSYTISPSGLPDGLDFSTSGGFIMGAAKQEWPSTVFTVTGKGQDASDTATIRLSVACPTGSIFDPVIGVCVNPENVGGGPDPDPTPEPSPSASPSVSPSPTASPASTASPAP